MNFRSWQWRGRNALSLILMGCALGAHQAEAQLTAPPSAIGSQGARPDYTALERGPHHTVWGRVVWDTNPSGEAVPHTNSYVELATGLNVLRNGAWTRASDQIEGFPGGAVARQGQHSVIFANNLATAGAIDMQAPDGKEFRSHILGLSYRDTTSGSNVLIAEIKDCQGVIGGTNTVLYPDAFTDLKASVRYTYTLAGLEQDVLLQEAPPAPESFGLNSDSTVLEVITEFINPPQPAITLDSAPPDADQPLPDTDLDFGAMKMGRGKAFFLGDKPGSKAVPVSKQWIETEQRHVLIEDVPVPVFQQELNNLPQAQGASKASVGNKRRLASKKRVLPSRQLARKSEKPMTIAKLETPRPSLVLDYVTLSSSATNYTFLANTTYYISGLVNLSGVTTIEANCVLKFPVSTTASIATTNVVCLTRPYCPAIFTAADDSRYGESVGGTTISGFYGKIALDLSGAPSLPVLPNFHFFYLSNALAGANITLQDAQFVSCKTVFASGSTQPTLNNALAYQIGTFLNNSAAGTITAAQMTAHFCTNFFANTTGTVRLTNCLFACVTNWQCTSTFTNSSVFVNSDTGLFQTVGGGSHYLSDGSPYRNIGNTNLTVSLLADIRTKTTYPPMVYSNATIAMATAFAPQAQRDTDVPDLGYEYEPIDYAFGGATANASLTFAPGTVAGWFRTSSGWNHAGHGIHLADSTSASFNGLAEAPTYWVRCCASQEGANGLWQGGYGPGGITGWTAVGNFNQAPVLSMLFTRCSTGGDSTNPFRDDNGYLVMNGVNSEFYTAGLGAYATPLNFTNCLFERVSLWTSWTDSGGVTTNCVFRMRNCTMRGGNLGLVRSSTSTPKQYPQWLIQDTILDGITTNSWSDQASGSSSFTYFNYNAFLSGSTRFVPNGANDVLVSGSFGWQSSWLGNYYLPSTSPVIDHGSTTADLIGLYHFTTQTNQSKELTSQVDIGFHVVATDANGKPLDSDGDGSPDYSEDLNGNGNVDSGETDWNPYSADSGLRVWITEPKRNSNLP